MNRKQWSEGRRYEKLPEPKREWEEILPTDPRWEETLNMAMDGNIAVVDDGVFRAKWTEHVPEKPRLI